MRKRPVADQGKRWPVTCALAACLLAAGCGDDAVGGALLPTLSITDVGPSPVLPNTRLTLRGSGFVVEDVAALAVVFQGEINGEIVNFGAVPSRVDDETLEILVAGDIERSLVRDGGRFNGQVAVLRRPLVDAEEEIATLQVSFDVAWALTPVLHDFEPKVLHVGESISMVGDGFLHSSEGASLVQFNGTMTTDFPPRTIRVDNLQIPATPPAPQRRDAVTFDLTPDVLGILRGALTAI